jgi:DNA-binding NarL/FixJ family response regulator
MDGIIQMVLGRTNDIWWDGVQKLLGDVKDVQVIAVRSNSSDVIRTANELRPNVVLLDEEISGADCGEVVTSIRELHEEISIIIVIKPYKNVDLASPFKAKAKAYIDKDIPFEDLLTALRCVAGGGIVVISQAVSKAILENLGASDRPPRILRPEYDISLSKRESEILTLLSKQPYSNKEIASALFITENTVKAHLGNILAKMKVTSRRQAAVKARENGLIEADTK